jgi:hypothetical protein
MIVQLYDDGVARVFPTTNSTGLCDVWAKDGNDTKGAEAALKRIRMQRVGKWYHYPDAGFREATVRWQPHRGRTE